MARPRTSTRDLDSIVAALAAWLQTQLSLRHRPVLFDLIADDARAEYVLRLPPPPDAFPLFPWYDLERQVRAMRAVRKRTDVPVPHVPWFAADPSILGAPFFVMERIHGRAPSDVPPYVLDGWVLETTPEEQLRMLSGVVGAIAGIHDTALDADDVNFFEFDEPGDTPLRRHVAHQRTYYDWIREGRGGLNRSLQGARRASLWVSSSRESRAGGC
jgi:aminoglycoside phosphotransferase (APT) family kinase protein